MTVQLLDHFPSELILRVLCFLDLPELFILQQAHSKFHQLIQASQGFQYRFAAARAGVQSNAHSTHTASERLALLKNKENSWLHMNVDFQKSIPKMKSLSGIYDLTGGIYLRGDVSKRSIYYCQLPSRSSDMVTWKTIDVDKSLVDIGVSVYEHDLIAILTYSPHPTVHTSSILEISLLELSTGKPHRLAKNPTLFIGETEASRPSLLLEIVGEYLVLVMTHTFREFRVPDTLQVYEWKTGTLTMRIERPYATYHEVIFLSPTVILLPNYHQNTLDVWELPTDKASAPTEPFLILALPSLSLGSFIISFTSRCEPNPTPGGTPHSAAPFHPNPEDAIIILNTQIQGPEGVGAYSLFVHRSSLLKVCTIDRPEDEDGVSHYIPSRFSIERIPGKRVRAWDNWGPAISRVLNTSRASLSWITTTAGQRAIVRHNYSEGFDEVDDEDDDAQDFQLLDFNPFTVKRVLRARAKEFNFHDLELEDIEITIPGIRNPIRSRLPYVGVDIPLQYSLLGHLEDFLLYEGGLLALLRCDGEDVKRKIEVLHVGFSTD